MKAEEASKIAKKSCDTEISKILEHISLAAANGETHLTRDAPLKGGTISKLVELGYTIEFTQFATLISYYTISWKL